MKITINICTYNERQNIGPMVEAIYHQRQLLPHHDLHLLFIDDTSPDKTYQEIKKYQKKYKWVHLLLRKQKQGLGAAHVAGMKYAIKNLQADAFVEMDADMQHDPHDLKKLIKALDQGCDYVIGSRYIKGGSIPKHWGFKRKFLSVCGNLAARLLLLLPQIHDVTTGFKLTRVKGFADQLSLESALQHQSLLKSFSPKSETPNDKRLVSNQFAYKIQLLHEMVQAGAKVKEVPIHFHPRAVGESKIINNEMIETLRVIFILQMRNPQIQRFVKFGIVGFIGYVVQATTLQILTWLNMPEIVIWGGSAEISIISNFTWNNLWTFKDQQITGLQKILVKFIHFNITSAGAIVIQIIAGSVLVKLFGPQYRQLYLPIIIAFLVVPYNYLMYTKLIWKKSPPHQS